MLLLLRRLSRYCYDEKTALLAQLVALFYSYDVTALEKAEAEEEKRKVDRAQVKMVAMLKAHLQVGRVKTHSLHLKILIVLVLTRKNDIFWLSFKFSYTF